MKLPLAIFMLILCSSTLFAQNVGIGAPVPNMKLHVTATNDTALLQLENTTTMALNTNLGLYFKNGSWFSGAIKTIGGTASTARMGFYTYAAIEQNGMREHMTILDAGNIGINTITPTQTLDVNGVIRIRGGSPGVGKVLTSTADGSATWQTVSAGRGFLATPDAQLVATSGVPSKILFLDNETSIGYDDDNAFNNTTHEYTIPVTGLYHFDVNVRVLPLVAQFAGACTIQMRVNAQGTTDESSASYRVYSFAANEQIPNQISTSGTIPLNAGDVLAVYYGQTSNQNVTIFNNASSNWTLFRVR